MFISKFSKFSPLNIFALFFIFLTLSSSYILAVSDEVSSSFVYQNDEIDNTEKLAQLNKISDPDDAEAGLAGDALSIGIGALKTFYDASCSVQEFLGTGDRCKVSSLSWVLGQLQNLIPSAVTIALCDQDLDTLIIEAGPGNSECWDPERTVTVASLPSSYEGQFVRVEGGFGLASLTSNMLASAINPETSPIPTNMALFMDDTFGDTIFASRAYAQNPLGQSFDGIVLAGWKVTRNIALSLFGILLSVAGIMIMLRTKIAPQVTVSVYSVLPMIPVSLAGIILSYPLVAFLYSLISPLTLLATSLGLNIVGTAFGASFAAGATDFSNLSAFMINAAINMFTAIQVGGFFIILLVIGALITAFLALLGSLYIMMKIYLSLMYIIVISPFVALMSIIPGKQGLLINLVKSILANVFALPVAILLFYIGFAIIAFLPTTGNATDALGIAGRFMGNYILLFIVILKFFIGLGVVWQGVKARGFVEKMLGVTGLFETEPKRK